VVGHSRSLKIAARAREGGKEPRVPGGMKNGRKYPGGKSGLTDMVCYKRLLYMVGFLRPPATTSGWTTFPTGYCNSEIQDGVQDGRHILKAPYEYEYGGSLKVTKIGWFAPG